MADEDQAQNKHGVLDQQQEEGESLTSTLPRREGWWKPFFLFQGCWLTPEALESATVVQAEFRPRADDVILATYPKCGTTWLKALAFTVANRSRHAVTAHDHPVLARHPQDLVPFLELPYRQLHPLHPVAELEALPSPRLLCTHLPRASLPPRPGGAAAKLGCRVVYLCRDPKDVLVSTWHYMNNVPGGFHIDLHTAFEFFCHGVSLYGPFWDHCRGYWKESLEQPERVLFLKYDEMMAHPTEHVGTLAEFLGVPFTEEEESGCVAEEVVRLCSFDNLKNLPVNATGVSDRIGGLPMKNSSYFRAGKVGDWRNYLTEGMEAKLDCIVEENLRGSGLSFGQGGMVDAVLCSVLKNWIAWSIRSGASFTKSGLRKILLS
ncbi:hypothetical protein U9M48_038279 [Paspalum notatum var. saurae]|uniref:Sulfotransferase n=1 Tax=Paspalum notatum var. saurae TaxID=547442 RepID=A0AAQ3UL09_PASNO